jgi:nucleoside-diphosphate-sugar epimerase
MQVTSRSNGRRQRIFITGATGVVGRRLVPALVDTGHTVTAVARSPQKAAAIMRAGAAPVVVDLFARDVVRRAVAGHDIIINLATHIPPSSAAALLPGAWEENDRIRRDASAILVEAALSAGVGRFVQESFAPVYPDRGDAWIDESTPIDPVRYNRTVADAEAAATRFAERGGAGVVLRFGAFYGPDAFQVRDLVWLVLHGWIPLFGSPEAYFSSISHDDAATAVAAALRVPSGIYNVIDDEPLPRREFANSLALALGVLPPRFPPRWMKRWAGSIGEMLGRSQRISNRKLRETSGWTPALPSVRGGWRVVVEEMAHR